MRGRLSLRTDFKSLTATLPGSIILQRFTPPLSNLKVQNVRWKVHEEMHASRYSGLSKFCFSVGSWGISWKRTWSSFIYLFSHCILVPSIPSCINFHTSWYQTEVPHISHLNCTLLLYLCIKNLCLLLLKFIQYLLGEENSTVSDNSPS